MLSCKLFPGTPRNNNKIKIRKQKLLKVHKVLLSVDGKPNRTVQIPSVK